MGAKSEHTSPGLASPVLIVQGGVRVNVIQLVVEGHEGCEEALVHLRAASTLKLIA